MLNVRRPAAVFSESSCRSMDPGHGIRNLLVDGHRTAMNSSLMKSKKPRRAPTRTRPKAQPSDVRMAAENPLPVFELLQAAAGQACVSGEQTVQFAQRLAELSERLQQPTAVQNVHSIIEELLAAALKMCAANLELARSLDSFAARALELTESAATAPELR